MLQSSDDLLYAVKFDLATNRRCASGNQRRVAGFVRRYGDDRQARMRGATLANKRLSLAVVEIVVRENQIEATGGERAPCRSETGNDRDLMRSQELTRDLLCEDRMVFKVENVHGVWSGLGGCWFGTLNLITNPLESVKILLLKLPL
jgi:hypothetical protein